MTRVLIMGAAGRDFHVFNVCFRNQPDHRVVAFTATQIPHIEDRRYPASLAGPGYPEGIPIVAEAALEEVIRRERVERVVFAYSDVSIAHVAACGERVAAAGARFETFDVDGTMLPAARPVIAVTAVRTGCGKSQTARFVAQTLAGDGYRVAVVRHPMPYGNLEAQRVQRFADRRDLKRQRCTIEEMEEYEPHLDEGRIVYAGIDYGEILALAEREADVVVWDGGSNDTPFFRPDLWITVCDPHRAGDELSYFPGHVNFRRAQLLVVNKTDSADGAAIARVEATARAENPTAEVLRGRSEIRVPNPEAIAGKRVLVIEDGPTVTHGGMAFGAGVLAARRHGAAAIVDPRPFLQGELRATFDAYPAIGPLLPAVGYGATQIADLERTIAATPCDLVLVATPVDLARILRIDQPVQHVAYALAELPALASAVREAAGRRARVY